MVRDICKSWLIAAAVTIAGLTATLQADDATNPEMSWRDQVIYAPTPAYGTGWLTAMTEFVHVSGNAQSFRQEHWMNSKFQYGAESFGWKYASDGWLAQVSGRGIVGNDDYGVNLHMQKRNVGFADAYYDQFPTYYNSATQFYSFAPGVFVLDKDLKTVRRTAGVTLGWTPLPDTLIKFYMDHWERDGDVPTLFGGTVTNGVITRYFYPQFEDVDEQRNRIGIEAQQGLGRFTAKAGVSYTDYHGDIDERNLIFANGGALTQFRLLEFEPEWRELRPYWSLTGDIIEKVLRLEYTGDYRHLTTDGTYDEHAFTPAGVPTNASRANNFDNNTHDGTVNETQHNLRLLYTPIERLAIYGGVGFMVNDSDQRSIRRQDTTNPPDGIPDVLTHFHNEDNRTVWMGNLGAEYRLTDWITLNGEAKWEHHDLDRNWNDEGSFRWISDIITDRTEYAAWATFRPIRQLKVVTRWKHLDADIDYHNKVNLDDGEPVDPGLRPGDQMRRLDRWEILTQYRPCDYLWFTYQLAAQQSDYFAHQPEPFSDKLADWDTMTNSFTVTVNPIQRLLINGGVSITDGTFETAVRHNATTPIKPVDGDQRVYSLDASYQLTRNIDLTGGISHRSADSIFTSTELEVWGGVNYRINKTWAAEFRYTYIDFDEHGNGNINDYTANVFGLALTASF